MADSTLITFMCRNAACPRRDRPVTRFVALDEGGEQATPVLPCNSCGQDMRGTPA